MASKFTNFASRNADYLSVILMRLAVVIFLFLASAYLFSHILNFFTPFISESQMEHIFDSADVLQMLSILAIFGSILAYVFKVVVQREIEDSSRHFSEAQAFKSAGLTQYYAYLKLNNKDLDGIKTNDLLMGSINITEKALKLAEQLDGQRGRNEMLICSCKNNIAWFLADRGLEADAERALALAYYCYERIGKYPDHAYAWSTTKKFVEKKFSTTVNNSSS